MIACISLQTLLMHCSMLYQIMYWVQEAVPSIRNLT